MGTNIPKTTKKWFLGAFMALSLALAGTLLLSSGFVFASQSDLYWNDTFLWTDGDGYTRLTTKFQHEQDLCWSGGNTTWTYGRSPDSDYHLRQYLNSKVGSNLVLVPALPSTIDWTSGSVHGGQGTGYCITYATDQVVAFYVGTSNYFTETDDSTITKAFGSGDWTQFAFAGGTQGGNWYSEPRVYWDNGSHPEPPPEPTGPSVTLTFPLTGEENFITSPFTITGTFENPDLVYNYLIANITTPSGVHVGQLFQYIGTSESGTLDPIYMTWKSGLSIGSYDLTFNFNISNLIEPYDFPFETVWYLQNITELPPELSNGETPPPVYAGTDPSVYYTANSDYTTPTPLFTSLSGALAPMIDTIGENLQFFANRFPISNAQAVGAGLGLAIVNTLGYIDNINWVLGGLPVVQFFMVYLVLLALVPVFRITFKTIDTAKP